MNVPLVSVVMPVYNAQRYLDAAIMSIREQTFTDFELIIVDDGSTDDSPAILRAHSLQDARIKVISRANTGIVGALNDGLALARGEFIARMDGDDLCDPKRFELQTRRMMDERDLVVLGSCALAIDPQGRRLGLAPVPLDHQEIEAAHLHGISCIYHPAAMMRRKAVDQVGRYRDLCPAEDFDLWLRLGEIGTLANLPQPLFIWRRTEDGIVATSLDRRLKAVKLGLADAWKRRGLKGEPELPERTIVSKPDLYRQWGWMALDASERKTGRHYAAKALIRDPLSWDSWRLAVCSLRGR